MTITVTQGDCVEVLRARTGPLFDSCVCDPPYHLSSIVERFGKPGSAEAKEGTDGLFARASRGFMGQEWDGGDVAFRVETWRAIYDQLKPGAHLVAFSGTRTYHRMVVAIDDAGFEIRDQLAWVYGSGFPKSLDVSKAIDKSAGAAREIVATEKTRDIRNGPGREYGSGINAAGRGEVVYYDREITAPATDAAREWDGWGTALKPAWEPICLARKPLGERTVAANVLAHGTGGLNIDACRIETGDGLNGGAYSGEHRNRLERTSTDNADGSVAFSRLNRGVGEYVAPSGRFPANLLHDGSAEVEAMFPNTSSGVLKAGRPRAAQDHAGSVCYGTYGGNLTSEDTYGDAGSAARFFYSAKAGPLDRMGTEHPTVKPVDVMRWLERMVTPPGGLILDPFAGSGTTGIAAMAEGFNAELIELLPAHVADIERKLASLRGEGSRVMEQHVKRKAARSTRAPSPLFGDDA